MENTELFRPFQKIPRLSRECTLTEKIDGTSGLICITPEGQFLTGSCQCWITPEDDNFGFSRWAHEHEEELRELGPGSHFGEWYGRGIQRNYGLDHRRFSLFNTSRWFDTQEATCVKGVELSSLQVPAPACCHVVPVLYQGVFSTLEVEAALNSLVIYGSRAAPGFMKPEGVVIYHHAAGNYFKKTCEHDDEPKNAHHLRAEGKLPRSPKARPYNPNTTGRRKGCEGYAGIERRMPK